MFSSEASGGKTCSFSHAIYRYGKPVRNAYFEMQAQITKARCRMVNAQSEMLNKMTSGKLSAYSLS